MKFYIFLVVFAFTKVTVAQTNTSLSDSNQVVVKQAKKHQDSLSEVYQNPETSILSKKQLKDFSGLEFYPINVKFRVSATFVRTPDEKPFPMATSTGIPRAYVKYGEVTFDLLGKTHKLAIYQNPTFVATPDHKYANHLMLGFTDYTSGDGSYGGGRYVDIGISDIRDNQLMIDFNKSYNPYCAYTEGYSCAIPPDDNDIKIRVEAGVRDYEIH